MRKVRIPLTALLLALTLATGGCSGRHLSGIATTGASASTQTTEPATTAASSETYANQLLPRRPIREPP